MIRDVCCLAVYDDSVLAFNLTPSREVWGSDMLDNAVQPSDSIPGYSGCVLLGSERVSQSCIQPHSFKGSVGL